MFGSIGSIVETSEIHGEKRNERHARDDGPQATEHQGDGGEARPGLARRVG